MSRIATAKLKLLDDLPNLVAELVPGGKRTGNVYSAKNPTRTDRHAGSFVVWLAGPAMGGWKDYASDEKGDVLDLVALVMTGGDRAGALRWAEDRFGLRSIEQAERDRLAAQAVARKRENEARQNLILADKRARAFKLFLEASPAIAGTPVETYLAGRGIPIGDVKTLDPATFRVHPRMEYWLGADRGNGRKLRDGPVFPALMTAMRDEKGTMCAFHATYVDPTGHSKAPVEKAKMIWPQAMGLVIRVAHGASGLDPEAAAEAGMRGPCVLVEGIEDALSIALAAPELRVWATGSLSGLLHVHDHACADSWLVFRDRDWGKRQAGLLFDRAIVRLEATGKPVRVEESSFGKDINDMLIGG